MIRRPPMTFAARVAAEVMEWEVCRDAKCEGCNAQVIWSGTIWCVHKPGHWTLGGDPIRWDPIANSADLMDVLGELRRRGWETRITIEADGTACVEIVTAVPGHRKLLGSGLLTPRRAEGWQAALAKAVCRAAIEAAGAAETEHAG